MNVLVFNIKTIPDLQGARRLWSLEGLSDKEVANIMFHKRRQETGDELLRLHLQKIVAVSVVRSHAGKMLISALGTHDKSESGLVKQFSNMLAEEHTELVTWNGHAFDIPVLRYRSMLHGLQTGRVRHSDTLSSDNTVKHTALMDMLAGGRADAAVPLHELATLLGYPADHINTQNVWDEFQLNGAESVRNGSELEALSTYLVYLRYKLMSGEISADDCQLYKQLIVDTIQALDKKHLHAFLASWQKMSGQA